MTFTVFLVKVQVTLTTIFDVTLALKRLIYGCISKKLVAK